MIKKAKAYITEDGATHASLEAAQHHQLAVLIAGMGEGDTDPALASEIATFICNHADAIRACLPKPPRKKRTSKAAAPKAAKVRKIDTGRGTFTTHEGGAA